MVLYGFQWFSYGFPRAFAAFSRGLFSAEAAIEARSANMGLNSMRLIRALRLLRSREWRDGWVI